MSAAAKLVLFGIAMALVGCATPSAPEITADQALAYSEAVKTEARQPNPVAITETRVVPTPGQLKPLPTSGETAVGRSATERPYKVIEQANRSARQAPDQHGYYNAIMTYDYDPGALYRVYTAPLQLTDIQLQPGERMISQPAAGDTTRWKVAATLSMENGVEAQHLLVTPKRPGIYTSLVISTDRRTYHLELFSYERTYMAAVNWNYPEDTLTTYDARMADVQRENALIDAATISLNDASFAYTITVTDGEPGWTPLRAFDDSRKTYIQFPASLAVSDAPALYVKKYGAQQIVNYRSVGNYYVVDGIFPRYELRVGSEEAMDIVEIRNDGAAERH